MLRNLSIALTVLCAAVAWAETMPPTGLQALDAKGQAKGACPLEHTDVQAVVSGWVSRVTVTQRFGNPFAERIEAVYTFPLPHDGAVFDMEMRVGDRLIKGLIKTREEAAKIYREARSKGHTAALLDEERPNIFTQQVANIRPGEKVEVRLRYTAILPFKDGRFSFVFPMVVGPRYIPGTPTGASGTGWSPDTDRVPDASRITPPVTPKGTRAGHDIGLSLTLAPGLPLGEVKSTNHEVDLRRQPWGAEIKLRNAAEIPNRDFVLEYTAATDKIGDAVLSQGDATGPDGYFALLLQPPARVAPEQAVPKDIVFVLDTSGSMMGEPIERAKESMSSCIEQLNPKDTFNLITFAGDTNILFKEPRPATDDNIMEALSFLRTRQGAGGTEMMKAVEAALKPSAAGGGLRVVCFMTDGYVGNDREIIDAVGKYPNARVFSFGIGSSVNRFLLDGMARAGRGEVEYVPLSGAAGTATAKDAASRFADRVRNPVLTDISLDWGGLPVADVQPARLPDLFSAKPLIVVGRYTKAAAGKVTLRGQTAAGPFQRTLDVMFVNNNSEHEVLPQLWAKTMVDALCDEDPTGAKADLKARVTQLGLDYRLMTPYTSFVAVEVRSVVENGEPKTVVVPVEMPEGVSYEGVFGERVDAKMAAKPMAMPASGGGYAGSPMMPGMPAPAPTRPMSPVTTTVGGASSTYGLGASADGRGAAGTGVLVLPDGDWKPVTLSAKAEPLGTVLAKIKAATGLKILVDKTADSFEPVTIELHEVPAAQAVAAVIGYPYVNTAEVLAGRLIVTKTGGKEQRTAADKLRPLLLKTDVAAYSAVGQGAPLAVKLTVTDAAPVTAKLTELKATKVTASADGKSVTATLAPAALAALAELDAVTRISLAP